MAVFVDDYNGIFRGMKRCHMMADSDAELDRMAEKIGLNLKWRQEHPIRAPHYDVCQSKKQLALKYGAIEIGTRDLALKFSVFKK